MNDREHWLEELLRLLKVESYGACHNNAVVDPEVAKKVKGNPWKTKIEVSRRFLFQLVFENSDVTDYVTEKLYQALEAGTIPVYIGAKGEVWRHLPNRTSIIYVADFKGPEDLAAYVQKVAENVTLYNSYLEWKKWPFSKEWKELELISYVGWRCRAAHLVAGIPYPWRGAFDDQPEGVYEHFADEKLKVRGASAEGSSWKDPWKEDEISWKSRRRDAWIARKRVEIRKQLLAKMPSAEQVKKSASLVSGAATFGIFVASSAIVLVALVMYRAKLRKERRGRSREGDWQRRRGRSMSPPFTLPISIGGADGDQLLPRLPAP
jgi:hypothetical protein